MSSIKNALNTTLYSLLSGNAALTALLAGSTSVYYRVAKDGATLPYVIFDYPSDQDENFTANDTKNMLVFVRGFAASAALAGSIDAKIDSALNKVTLSVAGWANVWTRREDSFDFVETDAAGIKTWMCGAQYRLRMDAN